MIIYLIIIFSGLYLLNTIINNSKSCKNIYPYDKIDIIYYINLDHRIDRNNNFLNEINKINFPIDKIKRISGIKNNNGAIGCSSSHIKVLKDFINSSFNICIIFEDDFEFTITGNEFQNQLSNIFINNIEFDVICLSGNTINLEETKYNFLKKVKNLQTTSGYMITKKFANNYLIDNFIIGKYLLENNPEQKYLYAIDMYWKILQPNNNWYLFNPKIGKQKESYSDIQNKIINYELLINNINIYLNIYVFWIDDNEISEKEKNILLHLKDTAKCNIILITKYNLINYIDNELIHPSYYYLSKTHKKEYLKIYFMNFFGGGYSDIKKTSDSWIKSYKDLYDNDFWICVNQNIDDINNYKIIDNYSYICKLQTPLTIELYNEIILLLNSKLELLKKYKKIELKYPIEYNELSNIFFKILFKYKDKIL